MDFVKARAHKPLCRRADGDEVGNWASPDVRARAPIRRRVFQRLANFLQGLLVDFHLFGPVLPAGSRSAALQRYSKRAVLPPQNSRLARANKLSGLQTAGRKLAVNESG